MGAVYKAEHRLMERTVALKIINRELTDRSAVVERFRREVKAAARLDHPNIVRAYDAEQAGDTHFLVMECVEGTTLARLVAERGPLTVAEACDCIRQAALGLQHAFEHGMVHRDVKPQNLMLVPGPGGSAPGVVKVLDFGLARLASELAPAGPATSTGIMLGTADYIAPEQADDPHTADTRAAIYALGCTLYFLLTGQPPFPEGTLMQKLMAHGKRSFRPLTDFRSDVPPALVEVLDRMTAKEPARRYPTPGEAARALAPFAVLAADPAASTEVAPASSRPPRRRFRIAVAVALALFLIGGGLLGVVAYRVATDRGEFVVEADNEEVEVLLAKHGLTVKDRKTGREYHLKPGRQDLDSGDYTIEVAEMPEGLQFSTKQFTIARGSKERVKVSLKPPAKAEKVGEVRRWEAHAANEGVWGVAFSPDGRRAISCGDDGIVAFWDVSMGKEVWSCQLKPEPALRGNFFRLRAVTFSPDGRHALVAAYDHTVRLLNTATGREIRRFEGHRALVHSVAFSSDGRLALSASGTWDQQTEQDASIRLWEVATGKELRRFDGHVDGTVNAVFSPDNRQVLSAGGDKLLRLWDATTGKELRQFEGHTAGVHSVAFSPDGSRILSGGWDKTVRLWDAESGKELRCFTGHTHVIGKVVFSSDGRRALSAGDVTVRLWDVATGKELHRCIGHTREVTTASLSPDGRHALSGSTDGTVRLWRLPDPPSAEKVGRGQ